MGAFRTFLERTAQLG